MSEYKYSKGVSPPPYNRHESLSSHETFLKPSIFISGIKTQAFIFQASKPKTETVLGHPDCALGISYVLIIGGISRKKKKFAPPPSKKMHLGQMFFDAFLCFNIIKDLKNIFDQRN